MFCSFVLDTIWKFYSATGTDENTEHASASRGASVDWEQLEKFRNQIPILKEHFPDKKSMSNKLNPGCVKDTLGLFVPLADAILGTCVCALPSPRVAAEYRMPFLLQSLPPDDQETLSALKGFENGP